MAKRFCVVMAMSAALAFSIVPMAIADQRAMSDSDARYVHHIDLYDLDNRRIGPDSTKPYSTRNTCGRCHDYDEIAGGWHFNSFDAKSSVADGRTGEPWIWTDPRTGTSLPLSYRDWPDRFDPAKVGISPFEMIRHFGGRLPGGGGGHPTEDMFIAEDSRWPLSGPLEIDCMICHAVAGRYDFELRRETIEDENFAWAPTAGLRIGSVKGSVSRIKTGSDLSDERIQKKMPAVEYRTSLFGIDDKVHFDLVRSPSNDACYQCHSRREVDANGIESRWVHDQDVHIISGMDCTDCHRNGIGHHTVRGFANEAHPVAHVETLSCSGCHLGAEDSKIADESIVRSAGRLGSPYPAHVGLPPIHFEKMSCTSCHAGPIPDDTAGGVLTSLAHGLGAAEHRSGFEMPEIRGPVFAPAVASKRTTESDKSPSHKSPSHESPGHESPENTTIQHSNRITSPQWMTWASFFGYVEGETVYALPPEEVYEETRRSLRVRKSFVEEVLTANDDETEEDVAKRFDEKVAAALTAIGSAFDVTVPVFVAAGKVYGLRPETPASGASTIALDSSTLRLATPTDPTATESVGIGAARWPLAHNVRPAGWALGAKGCLECHVDDGKIFASTVTPAGPTPTAYRSTLRQASDRDPPTITMAALRGVDEQQRLIWNGLFGGRKTFKYLTGASLTLTILAGLVAILCRRNDRPPVA